MVYEALKKRRKVIAQSRSTELVHLPLSRSSKRAAVAHPALTALSLKHFFAGMVAHGANRDKRLAFKPGQYNSNANSFVSAYIPA